MEATNVVQLKQKLTRSTPTKIDVDNLMKEFGIPNIGDMIPYEDISRVIQNKRKTLRWQTVVGSWRKRLFSEHNVLMEALINEGFIVLSPNERVGFANRKVESGVRTITRGTAVCMKTDPSELNEEFRKLYSKVISIPAKMRLAELTESKDLPF